MEGSLPTDQTPSAPAVRRYKILWRVFLIFNFALGSYMFIQASKKERAKEKTRAPAKVAPAATTVAVPTQEEPVLPPPITRPVIVREPIPEDQQREIFQWMLEEKRKIKPQNREEKQRINEEKAILKEFIRSKTVPQI